MSDIKDDFMSVDVLNFVNKHTRISKIGGSFIENFFDKEFFRVEDEDKFGYDFFDEFFEDDYNFLSKPNDSTVFEKQSTNSQNFEIHMSELFSSEGGDSFGIRGWPSLPEGDLKGLLFREDLIENTLPNGPVSLLSKGTGRERNIGMFGQRGPTLQTVGLNSVLYGNEQKLPRVGIGKVESSDILGFLEKSSDLEIKDREYSMMEFSEDLAAIPEFAYWLQDADFSDVF